MQMQSEKRMQSFGLHFLDERMQKPFLLGGIVTKSSLFYYSLCINAKMQREKIRKDEPQQVPLRVEPVLRHLHCTDHLIRACVVRAQVQAGDVLLSRPCRTTPIRDVGGIF